MVERELSKLPPHGPPPFHHYHKSATRFLFLIVAEIYFQHLLSIELLNVWSYLLEPALSHLGVLTSHNSQDGSQTMPSPTRPARETVHRQK
ncbi:hypothetical protein SCP_0500950 [Sparassis crispa]|uniref:Uncharacterized protein n=1 Tax=Sparassis crispa TaxID=139825 RepID=A0A401GLI7_9APHY|nr:hypothetical protein SCP_0500950 [Sparassis crispa]GBE83051.1 hypothetical protein SCP_0500950 [Sparassis crispa]